MSTPETKGIDDGLLGVLKADSDQAMYEWLQDRSAWEVKKAIQSIRDAPDLRDHFAGLAMTKLIEMADQRLKERTTDWALSDVEDVCLGSFEWADAMLKARTTKQP